MSALVKNNRSYLFSFHVRFLLLIEKQIKGNIVFGKTSLIVKLLTRTILVKPCALQSEVAKLGGSLG